MNSLNAAGTELVISVGYFGARSVLAGTLLVGRLIVHIVSSAALLIQINTWTSICITVLPQVVNRFRHHGERGEDHQV